MDDKILKVRNANDRCFEETMKRVMLNDPTTDITRLIECIFNDYQTDSTVRNSALICKMYQYCITEFKLREDFGYYKNIASKVMDYDKSYFAVFPSPDEL